MAKLENGRCGLCCMIIARLSEEDIKRIEKAGHKRRDFVELYSNEPVLKRINSYCNFLEVKNGIASCTIYDIRPMACREYVCIKKGESDCNLRKHYSVIEIDKHF
jgi:Fe-S-cluster containining protein